MINVAGFALADIIVVGLMLIFVIVGLAQGFVRSLVKILSGIASLVLAFFLCKTLAGFLADSCGLDKVFSDLFQKWFNVPEEIAGIDGIKEKLLELKLPSFLVDLITKNIENAGITATESFNSTVPPLLAQVCLVVISFIALWIVFKIVFSILRKLLKFVDKIPIIRGLNKLLGGIFGFLKGAILIFTVLLLVSVFSSAIPAPVMDNINNSTVTKWCYDNNIEGQIINYYINDLKSSKTETEDSTSDIASDSTSDSASENTSDSASDSTSEE